MMQDVLWKPNWRPQKSQTLSDETIVLGKCQDLCVVVFITFFSHQSAISLWNYDLGSISLTKLGLYIATVCMCKKKNPSKNTLSKQCVVCRNLPGTNKQFNCYGNREHQETNYTKCWERTSTWVDILTLVTFAFDTSGGSGPLFQNIVPGKFLSSLRI